MTHRGDNDWHGWPLQAIVEPIAQKRYAELREHWPAPLQAQTPESLAELGRRDADGNAVMRTIMDGAVASVIEVLDVVNTMDHPLVSELEVILSQYELSGEASPHRALATIAAVVANYRENVEEV